MRALGLCADGRIVGQRALCEQEARAVCRGRWAPDLGPDPGAAAPGAPALRPREPRAAAAADAELDGHAAVAVGDERQARQGSWQGSTGARVDVAPIYKY